MPIPAGGDAGSNNADRATMSFTERKRRAAEAVARRKLEESNARAESVGLPNQAPSPAVSTPNPPSPPPARPVTSTPAAAVSTVTLPEMPPPQYARQLPLGAAATNAAGARVAYLEQQLTIAQAAAVAAEAQSVQHEERMTRLEQLVTERSNADGAPAASSSEEVMGLQNALQMVTAQKEAASKTVDEMEIQLSTAAMTRNELTLTHRSEKETLGRVMEDLETQLHEATSSRSQTLIAHQRDKEILISQLNKADGRVDELIKEVRFIREGARKDIDVLTTALREKEMEVLSLERGRSSISCEHQDSQHANIALEQQVQTLTAELNLVEERFSHANSQKDELLERERQLEMHLMDVEQLKNEREGQIATLKRAQTQELERLQTQLGREERDSILELERARADKEFLRNEIAFYKKTVEELSSNQHTLSTQAQHEKSVLARVINDLETQLNTGGTAGTPAIEAPAAESSVDQLRVQLEEAQLARASDEAAAREEIEWLNEQLQILEDAYTRADTEKRSTIARTQTDMEDMSKELALLASQLSDEDREVQAAGISESKRILDFIMTELRALRLELEDSSAGHKEAMSVARGKQQVLLEAKSDLEYLSSETKEIVRQLGVVRKEKEDMSAAQAASKEMLSGYLHEADTRIVEMQLKEEKDTQQSQLQLEHSEHQISSLQQQLDACKANMAGEGGSEAATKELLRLKEAEVDQLWHERFEDRRKMDEHFAELQHAILSLQNEKSQYQMESTNDKQVTERILSELEISFKVVLQEGEDRLSDAHQKHTARVTMLEEQLEAARSKEAESTLLISQLKQHVLEKDELLLKLKA